MDPFAPLPKQSLAHVPALVLMAGLFLSTIAALFAFRAFDSAESQRFSEAVDEIQGEIQGRLDFLTTSVRQLAASYAINPNMSEEMFIDFTYSTGIHANDDGIYTYGIVKRTPGKKSQSSKFYLELREVGTNAARVTAPLGVDLSNDKPRVALFRQAIETSQVILSLNLPGLTPRGESGHMMLAASYKGNRNPATISERYKTTLGIAYARFSARGLFDQALKSATSYKSHLDVEIFDGDLHAFAMGQANSIYKRYSKTTESKVNSPRSSTFEIEAGNRVFTVRILSSRSQIWSTPSYIAFFILALGIAASLLCFRAIRERERNSEQLFKSERQLKLVTESLPVLIAYIGSDFTYKFNNRVYESVTGRPRSEITDHKVEEIVGPIYREQLAPQLERAMKGESIEQDWTLKHPNGVIRHYHQVLLPDIDSRGNVNGVVAMHTDITERTKAQEHVLFLEEVSSILATSLDPSVVADKLTQKLLSLCDWCVIELLNDEGEIDRHLYASSTPERMNRLRDFYKDFPPTAKDRRLTARARETKQTQYIEHVTFDSLKASIPDEGRLQRILQIGFESIVIVPLTTGERVLGTMALYSGERAKPFTKDDVLFFEQIAVRSSLAFENARLYAESQNLNRAKDHFLAMLSHELRTPMNVILGWIEILMTEDVDDATYSQAIDTLNRNAKVQIQLINDLLDVSRIINGKLLLHASQGNLGVQPSVRAKNIECTLTIEGDPRATIDSERIQQVLWNLLSNAVKFTPTGGKIQIAVKGDQNDVRLTISDSGQGIDAGFLPFVFDRFRQEEGGFTRSQGGLGLGLSIVRYIVEGHGGTISVTSEGRDRGTSFIVVLPKISRLPDV
jgi:PAS domain S-box-containing protein